MIEYKTIQRTYKTAWKKAITLLTLNYKKYFSE